MLKSNVCIIGKVEDELLLMVSVASCRQVNTVTNEQLPSDSDLSAWLVVAVGKRMSRHTLPC